MGYSTEYEGELKFTRDLTGSELAQLQTFLEVDVRDIGHPDAHNEYGGYWYHVDFKLASNFDGITWNGMEKSGDLSCIANFLIDRMRETVPDFGLTGRMRAQGETFDDRWELVINERGRAEHRDVVIEGTVVKCPHCEGKFELLDERKVK